MIKRVLVLVVVTGLLLAGIGVPGAAAGDTIKIALVAPFTGLGSILGDYIKGGLMLAVDEINAAGGVRGKKFEVIVYDDAASPATSINVVKKAILNDKVSVVFGPNMSSCVLAVHKVAWDNKVPMLVGATSPSFRYTKVGNPWLFRLRADDDVKVTNQVKFAVDELKVKRPGVIYGSTDYCVSAKEVLEREFEKRGIKVVAAEQIKEGEKDATGQLLKLKRANVDSIMGLTHEPEAAVVVRQIRQLGLDVPIVGFSAWGVPAFTDLAGSAAVGVISVQGFTPEDPNPVVQEFVRKYKAKYGKLPSDPAQAYYDGVRLLAHVMEQVGFEPEAIREGLEKVKNFPGLQGELTCDEHHNFTNFSLISRFLGDKWEILQTIK